MADGGVAAPLKIHEVVELSGGVNVVIQEWSWAKLPELIQYLDQFDKMPILVEHSVRPEDREKLKGLGNRDMSKLAEAVFRLNVTEDLLKNLTTLAARIQDFGKGEGPSTESKKP